MKKLGFGCMRLPILDKDQSKINMEQFKRMVDTFIEKGFTYFDTAFMYHDNMSESALKEALVDRYDRDKYTITTKLPIKDVNCLEDNERIFNIQLNRLGVDYIDYYLMHAVSMDRYNAVKDLGTFDFMQRMKKEGKAKHIGFSYHDTAENLDKILSEIGEWVEYVQLQLNYLDWESDKIQSRLCYEVCQKYHKSVIVMEPVKGGTLCKMPIEAENLLHDLDKDASLPSFAIRFAASLDNVFMVLSGMSNLEQLEDNTSYMQDFKPLNEKEKETIKKVADIIKTTKAIPCTACRYCVEKCPKQINIPEIFKVYNDSNRSSILYNELFKDGSTRPYECIECGMCESLCPQDIEIREWLKIVRKAFFDK